MITYPVVHDFIVDPEDEERVSIRKWYRRPDGYFEASFNYRKVLLHRFIMQPPTDKVVDHINHNKADNRKENLTVCTQYDNCQNRRIGEEECVYFNKGKWQAAVQILRVRVYLGRFATKKEATNAVKEYKAKKRQEKTNFSIKLKKTNAGLK